MKTFKNAVAWILIIALGIVAVGFSMKVGKTAGIEFREAVFTETTPQPNQDQLYKIQNY